MSHLSNPLLIFWSGCFSIHLICVLLDTHPFMVRAELPSVDCRILSLFILGSLAQPNLVLALCCGCCIAVVPKWNLWSKKLKTSAEKWEKQDEECTGVRVPWHGHIVSSSLDLAHNSDSKVNFNALQFPFKRWKWLNIKTQSVDPVNQYIWNLDILCGLVMEEAFESRRV